MKPMEFYFRSEIKQVLDALNMTNAAATAAIGHPEMIAYRKGFLDALNATGTAFRIDIDVILGSSPRGIAGVHGVITRQIE